jgi:hypothetical protein
MAEPNYMHVDLITNVTATVAVTAPRPSIPRPKVESQTEFSASTALNGALKQTPELRRDEVARAAKLVADTNYPPAAVLRSLAHFLVQNIDKDE